MAFVIADRVKETTTTTGTGTITLAGAATGFQSFAIIGNSNTTYSCIASQTGSEWEVGIGTYTLVGTTLARTTVFANSAATQPTALTFSAGTKDVFVTYPSTVAAFANGTGAVQENYTTLTGTYTMTPGKNGMSVGPVTISSGASFTVGSGQRWLVL